jgi:hypothetical protein
MTQKNEAALVVSITCSACRAEIGLGDARCRSCQREVARTHVERTAMLNDDVYPRTRSSLLIATALVVALSSCRTSSPASPSFPPPLAGEAMATIVWIDPSSRLKLVISSRPNKASDLVLTAIENGKLVTGRFAIPAGRSELRYEIHEIAQPGRWQSIEHSYSCDTGGAIRAEIRAALAAGDRVAFQATYDSDGCRLSPPGPAGRPETLPLLEGPFPARCCAEPVWREGE